MKSRATHDTMPISLPVNAHGLMSMNSCCVCFMRHDFIVSKELRRKGAHNFRHDLLSYHVVICDFETGFFRGQSSTLTVKYKVSIV